MVTAGVALLGVFAVLAQWFGTLKVQVVPCDDGSGRLSAYFRSLGFVEEASEQPEGARPRTAPSLVSASCAHVVGRCCPAAWRIDLPPDKAPSCARAPTAQRINSKSLEEYAGTSDRAMHMHLQGSASLPQLHQSVPMSCEVVRPLPCDSFKPVRPASRDDSFKLFAEPPTLPAPEMLNFAPAVLDTKVQGPVFRFPKTLLMPKSTTRMSKQDVTIHSSTPSLEARKLLFRLPCVKGQNSRAK